MGKREGNTFLCNVKRFANNITIAIPYENMITISLENMEFRAFHGCYDLEKKVGNRFLVDVSLEYDGTKATEEDCLDEAINYLEVYETVRGEMSPPSNLIEHVAGRIANAVCRRFPQVEKITVKVSKLAPPIGGKMEKVSATITR